MNETIDGNQSLSEQESAIQFKEATGFELTALAADESNPPTNNASFKELPTGRPKRIHLIRGSLPEGETEVLSGNIFVDGNKTDVVAFRK
jgi:hypothetical protein